MNKESESDLVRRQRHRFLSLSFALLFPFSVSLLCVFFDKKYREREEKKIIAYNR
jgi:hypothetical protein